MKLIYVDYGWNEEFEQYMVSNKKNGIVYGMFDFEWDAEKCAYEEENKIIKQKVMQFDVV